MSEDRRGMVFERLMVTSILSVCHQRRSRLTWPPDLGHHTVPCGGPRKLIDGEVPSQIFPSR